MKKYILILATVFLTLASCKKETIEPAVQEPDPVAATEYSVEFVAYSSSGYNTDIDVYDGNTLVGNLSGYTTILFGNDIYNLTTSQGGLSYNVVLGQGENINIRNAAGDTLIMFGGNFALNGNELDLPDGFSTNTGNAIRVQPINDGTDLLISIESGI
jgi:hypothetical protein